MTKSLTRIVQCTLKYFLMGAVLIYSLVVAFWLLWPYDPITVQPIRIVNSCKEVQQGGVLIYELEYHKRTDKTGRVARHLVDTYTITYAPSLGINTVGKGIAKTHLPIPKYATPGIYFLRWSVTYEVNPLRKVTVTVDSEKFLVYPKDMSRTCFEDTLEDDHHGEES